jgi:dihydroorotate dehydrogenase electron transfer subunit
MRPINCFIQEVRSEASLIRTFRLDRNLDPAPGQYVMVWIRGVDEVPMSFSGPDTITVQSVGETTQALFKIGAGSSIGLRGPLGNGFILRGGNILLIGGGVGTAPLAFLGEQAKRAGIKVTSLAGFRSAEDLIFQDRLEALGDLIITTDDGSAGIKGRVAEGLKELDPGRFSQIYLCGPEMMMWDIISRTREHAGKTQACINRYFKCAAGVCGSCCLDPDGTRICVEGPVIMADRLLESEFGRYRRGPDGGKGLCRG